MSHTASIKSISVTNVAALRAAVADLQKSGIKCSLKENAKPRAYYPNQPGMGLADFVLQLDDSPYDIGFYKEGKGYEARTDFHAGHINRILGTTASSPEHRQQAQMGKLFRAYATQTVILEARAKGKLVRQIPQKDGGVELVITGF